MVCAIQAPADFDSPAGENDPIFEPAPRYGWDLGDRLTLLEGFEGVPANRRGETAEASDPFDDFEEDDFDDDFDDDFEEDWEDDLTEDDEFPDTFGGEEPEEPEEPAEDSPFADDPDFDDA